jgi:hypothetical protein
MNPNGRKESRAAPTTLRGRWITADGPPHLTGRAKAWRSMFKTVLSGLRECPGRGSSISRFDFQLLGTVYAEAARVDHHIIFMFSGRRIAQFTRTVTLPVHRPSRPISSATEKTLPRSLGPLMHRVGRMHPNPVRSQAWRSFRKLQSARFSPGRSFPGSA